MEDTLLEEIESFERESKSPKRIPAAVCEENESESNDEFDEIIKRDRLGLSLEKREVPGSSPLFSEDDDFELRPPGKRLGPIGQDNDDWAREEADKEDGGEGDLVEKVKQMEEEQEELSSSLMALTSHYAKVQLRLQQIVAAPNSAREELLRDLEQFAFRGIPNMRPVGLPSLPSEQETVIEDQKRKQTEAIEQLRDQLEELESYAYLSGDSAPPSSLVLERQRLVMEQLRDRLNLNLEDVAALSEAELRASVDSAVGEIVNPLKMKSQLVGQLQTQVTDLEMFIQFLQEESSVKLPLDPGCGCEKHSEAGGTRQQRREKVRQKLEDQQETITMIKRALQTLQVASSLATLGCGSDRFKKNSLKEGKEGNHFGDLRARLELCLDRLVEVCSNVDCRLVEEKAGTEDDIPVDFLVRSPQVTAMVRKELAVCIRDLIHHGLGQTRPGAGLLPFSGCMSGRQRSRTTTGILHAWDVVMKFYEMKGGAEYNSAPARRLSRSFGLDLAGSISTNKQALLQTIGQILTSHSQYKRSPDAHFKALICAGLNKRKLVPWLRVILRNQTVLETMYQPWSYSVTTGFDDTFKLLERLSVYVFDLPVDIAVKQFEELEEAF